MDSSGPDFLHEYLTELNSVEDGDFGDLKMLKNEFKSRQVFGVGEATHSSSEFFGFRQKLFRFLAEELGYRVFAWEASFGETLKINKYVMKGEGTAREALEHISSPNCKMEEVLEFIEWIREFNKDREDKICFYGFDMQNDIASFKKLESKLADLDSSFVEENRELLDFIQAGKMMLPETDEEKYEQLEQLSEELNKLISQNREEFEAKTSEKEVELVQQLTTILEQSLNFCKSMNSAGNSEEDYRTYRDRCMAENISWIKDHEEAENIFITAHNAHLKKTGKPEEPASQALGHYLDSKYGTKYYAVGLDFGTGSFAYMDMESQPSKWEGEKGFSRLHKNTLAKELMPVGNPLFIDLEKLNDSQDEKARNWLEEEHRIHTVGTYFHLEKIKDHYDPIKLAQNFDALVFLPEVTAARPLDPD